MDRICEITVENRFADSEDTLPTGVRLQEMAQKNVERRSPIGLQCRRLEEEPRSLPWRGV